MFHDDFRSIYNPIISMSQRAISKSLWGNIDNVEVFCFKMVNKQGAFIEISNYGATMISVFVPDKEGKIENVILGFPLLQSYVNDQSYVGSTIGRFANRISNATFPLDEKMVELEQNDGLNNNHSGRSGFNKKTFDYLIKDDKVIFSLLSPDGDGGFPGNLRVEVHYHWSDENELKIDYFGETDRNTLFNLTNHSYFDLSSGKSTILDHCLSVFSDQIVYTGADYIPTGDIVTTDEDLTFTGTRIEDKLLQADGTVKGVNVCYVLDPERQKLNLPAARLFDTCTGRSLTLYTSYPGLIFYAGSYLDTIDPGYKGNRYKPFDGVCLEAQFFPDSPNHPSFPSAKLCAGETVHHYILYKFNTHK